MQPDRSIRAAIYEATYGDPPDRACLPNRSDREWETYMLGVEEAACAAEAYVEAAEQAFRHALLSSAAIEAAAAVIERCKRRPPHDTAPRVINAAIATARSRKEQS